MQFRGSVATGILISLAMVLIPSSAFSAQKITAGTTCKVLNQKVFYLKMSYNCTKSGKKLLWSNGVRVATSTPEATSKPTSKRVFYIAPDSTPIYTIRDIEGCAVGFDSSGKQITTPILQALVDGVWLDVKPIEIGWKKTCNISNLPNNKYSAYAKAALEDKLKVRWKFIGPVNIFGRDEQGNGISKTSTFQPPIQPLQPHPMTHNYGITWSNITSKIKDISAAAWTDAQNTMIRNQNLPDIYKGFTYYLSPGALKTDPLIGDATTLLKRVILLYANFPRAKNVYFVATTQEEQIATQTEMEKNYPDALIPLTRSLNSIYGINVGDGVGAGSVFVQTKCNGSYGARNAFNNPTNNYPSITTSVVTISVCPASAGEALEGRHIAAHEYVHTIQVALNPGGFIRGYQPCWMTEGEAVWSTRVVSPNFAAYLSQDTGFPYYLSPDGLNRRVSTQLVWTSQDVETYLKGAADVSTCANTDQFTLSYSLGTATVEALVSLGGTESLLALDERLSQRQEINDAFKDVYGITWDEALPILSQVVAEKITLQLKHDPSKQTTPPVSISAL